MRLPLVLAMALMSACAGRYHTEPTGDGLQARLDIALRTRAQLSYYLVQQGAVARPPRPVQIAEARGVAPFDGAEWIAGTWAWANGRWEWRAGYWSEPDVFTAMGPSVAFGGDVESESMSYDDGLANLPIGDGPKLRDHRTHRNTSAWTSSSSPDANVRDHRTLSSSSWKSSSSDDAKVRDHRSDDTKDSKKDDDDKKDYGGGRFVRDHR